MLDRFAIFSASYDCQHVAFFEAFKFRQHRVPDGKANTCSSALVGQSINPEESISADTLRELSLVNEARFAERSNVDIVSQEFFRTRTVLFSGLSLPHRSSSVRSLHVPTTSY